MWLDESAEAVKELNGRIEEDFFLPARKKYTETQDSVSKSLQSVDTTFTDKIGLYTWLKKGLIRLKDDYLGTTQPIQENLVQLMDYSVVKRCLSGIQSGLRMLAYAVFFLVGLVVSQTKTRAIVQNLRSPWSSLLFLPLSVWVASALAVKSIEKLLYTVREDYVDKHLPKAAELISTPFSKVLPAASKVSPRLADLVVFSMHMTVVLFLGVPVATMVIADFITPEAKKADKEGEKVKADKEGKEQVDDKQGQEEQGQQEQQEEVEMVELQATELKTEHAAEHSDEQETSPSKYDW